MSFPPRAQPRVLIPQQIKQVVCRGGVQVLTGACMGTSWCVRLVDNGVALPVNLAADIAALLERIENQMSHFRPQSDLCRFAALVAGEQLALPPEFARVLRGALEVATQSNGAFDPTIADLIDAWGFGARQHFSDTGFMPPLGAMTSQRAFSWKEIDLDAANQLRQPGGMALNLGAIAKGYAVDAVSEWLTQSGWPHHLVEIGGELRGSGNKPDGQPWWVALELPAADCPLPATHIALHGLSVATSGDYRRRYRLGDQLIQHTLDPRSGLPLQSGLSSVTVLHTDCLFADAWATALMVLGQSAGLALAEEMQLPVLLQGQDGAGHWREVSSRAWQALAQ